MRFSKHTETKSQHFVYPLPPTLLPIIKLCVIQPSHPPPLRKPPLIPHIIDISMHIHNIIMLDCIYLATTRLQVLPTKGH